MNNLQLTIYNLQFLLLLLVTPAFAQQHDRDDKKIQEIESYHNYTIQASTAEDLKEINTSGDTSIVVLQLINFSSKKGLGKIIQRSRFQGTEIKRTCYFDHSAKLFAMNDSVWYDNHTKRVFTYYFSEHQFSAVDENRKDATAKIDRGQIYDWLVVMFSKSELDDWGIFKE